MQKRGKLEPIGRKIARGCYKSMLAKHFQTMTNQFIKRGKRPETNWENKFRGPPRYMDGKLLEKVKPEAINTAATTERQARDGRRH